MEEIAITDYPLVYHLFKIKAIYFHYKESPDRYTGAHKKVIPEIMIMVSVRRGW